MRTVSPTRALVGVIVILGPLGAAAKQTNRETLLGTTLRTGGAEGLSRPERHKRGHLGEICPMMPQSNKDSIVQNSWPLFYD